MATRSVYLPKQDNIGVNIEKITFEYYSGLSLSQKQKSINSLKKAAEAKGIKSFLEVSSKSDNKLGVALSAFNLKFTTIQEKKTYTVENAFQASKVFEHGGPYKDLLEVSPLEAKKDSRIKNSGNILKFNFCGIDFPNKPLTFFYDWLYINALLKNNELAEKVLQYDCFSDFEFNENKSINCQAYSVALYVSLKKNNVDLTTLKNKNIFLKICESEYKERFSSISYQTLVEFDKK